MSQLAQLQEHRRHLRVDYQRRAWCEHRDWTQYLAITNLSHGGLFVQTPTPFLPGEQLRVAFSDDGRIVLEAEVVWATRGRQVGVGCRIVAFVEGEARYAAMIDRLASSSR
ncbi:MAG TPA: PilZ domain-containing protein [Polyangiales bacterium]|nr:PilZ domain-containing protein [Polyangiales bacterium]